MAWMSLSWIIGVLLIVVVVKALAPNVFQRDRSPAPPNADSLDSSPEDIAKRRYAKGEIDRQVYEQLLADLRK